MKKFILFFFCVFFILPSIISAHTSLSSSNPSEGQVVTEQLEEIILNYATTIEELSTMDLMRDGSKIPLKDIRVENKQLIGAISEPLANGSYKIQWKIVGEDGHPITGEINFTVDRDQNQSETDSVLIEENQGKQENNSQTNQTEQKNTSDTVEQPDNNSSSTMLVTIAIVLIVIFGIVLLLLTGKKKR
ncbi:copper resistance protein CopC [Neobacillus niacini]|uniref:copper resistance protein CopC n=1 Tax=Neobacillus niacini TaxID=86668 RepID=UPI0005F0B102|nr:copper resistance protein CopC [Neobacillus niacini]